MSRESKSVLKTSRIFKSRFGQSGEYTGTKLSVDAGQLVELERELTKIQGQEYACQCVKELLFGVNHQSHEKGLGGCFVFAGGPAVGKTMLAETIAKCLKRPFLRIDMSTKNDKESSVFELFGIHPSYKSAEEGELTGFVKNNPVSVVLLDECEKAHPNVLNALLQMFERGETEDKFTKKLVNFRDAIVIITTNVGKDIYDGEIGKYIFSSVSPSTIQKALETEINPVTDKPFFTPALVSRFFSGKVIMFNKLRPEVIHKIVTRDIEERAGFYESLYGIKISLDPSELAKLLILNQGENADIRSLLKASKEVLAQCMSCGVEAATDKGAPLLFDRVSLEISTEDASGEARELFECKTKSRLLLYCGDTEMTSCESDRVETLVVNEETDLRSLGELDITAAVINVDENKSPFVRRLFDRLAKELEVPTYVYSNKSVGRSHFYYYVKNGATQCYSPVLSKERVEDFVKGIIEGLDLSNITGTLFRSCKVVEYEVDYEYEEKSGACATLHGLKVGTAMDPRHGSGFVDRGQIPNVKYKDIIGADSAKAELQIASRYVSGYKRYLRQGVRIPRGILLEGEPGTGKTMLAKAFASEAGIPFIQKNATEFLIKWVGDGAKAIRELFKTARRYSPCVVFIDEIDVIARSRSNSGAEHTHSLVNAFLSEMDGFANRNDRPVFVIYATNFSSKKGESYLDSAFLRRFDKRITVELPSAPQREEFLKKALSRVDNSVPTQVISQLAKRTVGWSLADLGLVVQNAIRKYEDKNGLLGVDSDHLIEELESFSDGEKRTRNEQEIRKTAVHEAGHALVGAYLGIPPVHTTIVSRGSFGGYVYTADEEKTCYTKKELLNKICMALAGRAAECLEYGEDGINTGAASDIKQASSLVRSMLFDYGMDGGLLYFEREKENDSFIKRAQEILSQQYEASKTILTENREKLLSLADALVSKNSLSQEEIEEILQ